jgi:hypothetical protein
MVIYGFISGRVTVKNLYIGGEPSICDASCTLWGIASRPAMNSKTIKGRTFQVSANTTMQMESHPPCAQSIGTSPSSPSL